MEEIRGRHHRMFVDPSFAESQTYKEFWASLQNGEYKAADFQRFAKGGREIWIQATYTPVFDDDGNVTSARHSQGIAKFNAPRVKERVAVELSEEVLERFVGNYRYAIGATLTIRRDGSKCSENPKWNRIFFFFHNRRCRW